MDSLAEVTSGEVPRIDSECKKVCDNAKLTDNYGWCGVDSLADENVDAVEDVEAVEDDPVVEDEEPAGTT